MKRLSILTASTAALALAACGEPEAEVEEPVETADVETTEYDPMTRDYELSEEVQARRDEFDEEAFQDEYRGYRDDIVGEQVALTDPDADADADMSEDDHEEMEAAAQPREPGTNMRARQNMTWSYLDRNNDGQLSVAEYAIWAIPLDPNNPKPNDETQPYVTAEQANKAADSFFYYDRDGDSYLDQREFTAARRGEDIA